MYKDPESKAEKTANLLKEKIIDIKTEKLLNNATSPTVEPSLKDKENIQNPLIENQSHLASTSTSSLETNANNALQTNTRLTLWQRITKELKHYYDGFKLLYFETKIASSLLKKVLRGETLTRRERRQVI